MEGTNEAFEILENTNLNYQINSKYNKENKKYQITYSNQKNKLKETKTKPNIIQNYVVAEYIGEFFKQKLNLNYLKNFYFNENLPNTFIFKLNNDINIGIENNYLDNNININIILDYKNFLSESNNKSKFNSHVKVLPFEKYNKKDFKNKETKKLFISDLIFLWDINNIKNKINLDNFYIYTVNHIFVINKLCKANNIINFLNQKIPNEIKEELTVMLDDFYIGLGNFLAKTFSNINYYSQYRNELIELCCYTSSLNYVDKNLNAEYKKLFYKSLDELKLFK